MIDTPAKGRVTVVMVGAMIVGRITVSAIDARDVPLGDHVIAPAIPGRSRGDEIGVFHLGSTAVVLRREGRVPSWRRPSGPNGAARIRMGEPLGEGGTR